MSTKLLSEIELLQAETGVDDYRIGFNSVKNGRLVERLRAGGRVWPETEKAVRAYIRRARREHIKNSGAA